jgi:hypothetical protein
MDAYDEGDEERVDWFGEPEAGDEDEIAPAEADWLQELAPADLDDIDLGGMDVAEDEDAEIQPEFANVDDFLATLDQKALALPDTGELDLGSNVDYDLFKTEDEFRPAEKDDTQTRLPLAEGAPEWLADVTISDEESLSAVVRRKTDRPLEDLSDRLKALHEAGMGLPASSEQAQARGMTALLPGVTDTLPPAEFGAAPTVGAGIALGEVQQARANLLRDLIGLDQAGVSSRTAETAALLFGEGTEAEAAAQPRRRRRLRLASNLDRILVAVVLLFAVLLPFVRDTVRVGSLPPAVFSAGSRQAAFFSQIDAVEPGSLVLVAAEYNPTGAAELDDATDALLRHLVLLGARPVIVGSSPTGLLHAGNIMESIAEDGRLVANRDYYLGRYLVADVVGLRAFTENVQSLIRTDIRGDETGLDVESLDEFALIVLIAEQSDSIRRWAEQVAPSTSTTVIAVTGYAASPLAAPYLDAIAGAGWAAGGLSRCVHLPLDARRRAAGHPAARFRRAGDARTGRRDAGRADDSTHRYARTDRSHRDRTLRRAARRRDGRGDRCRHRRSGHRRADGHAQPVAIAHGDIRRSDRDAIGHADRYAHTHADPDADAGTDQRALRQSQRHPDHQRARRADHGHAGSRVPAAGRPRPDHRRERGRQLGQRAAQ